MTATLLLFAGQASAALSLKDCRKGYETILKVLRIARPAEPSGPEAILPEVRRWLTTQKKYLADIKTTQNVGDVLEIAGVPAKIMAKLGHGSEGDVYLVETAQGLRTLKTFFSPEQMSPHLRELKSDFPMPSPKIFERDEKMGRVLMEYIEGASVDHIMGRWPQMGISELEMKEIMAHWNREQSRIRAAGRWPPDGFNVIYSFRDQVFYRVDSI
jgi:hypothetical protein